MEVFFLRFLKHLFVQLREKVSECGVEGLCGKELAVKWRAFFERIREEFYSSLVEAVKVVNRQHPISQETPVRTSI